MHIYKKWDLGDDDSMGKRILIVFDNQLFIATTIA